MEVWFRIFAIAHGPKAHLRPLVGIPKSKCYMMFMCASSLHVCEKCFGLAGYNADSLYKLPLPIPILLPRRPTNAITYLGERLDPNWTIRMCLSCRQDHILNFEEPFPRLAEKDELERSELYQKYPCTLLVPELRHLPYVNEITAVKHMRRHFGGNVGVKAYQGSTEEYDEKTGTRIRWYQLQE
ncbi:hypothetical protein BG011_009272 [Mortierella polycephala]|uniref:Uncharacterized protein n=1 Tax=Mortierella polycephala TaxID=41804 RepID=A0A9P6TWV8_9FUNG|nr:hypothetical protein BG011_009272 [Mortierella polycephala]